MNFPKNPKGMSGFRVSSCHLFGGPEIGVSLGVFGVSIGGVRSLRVFGEFPTPFWRIGPQDGSTDTWVITLSTSKMIIC